MGDLSLADPSSTYLLRQVRVLDPLTQSDRVADVLIVANKIRALEASIETLPDDVDANAVQSVSRPGAVLGPGLVDLYSHASEPGFEPRETIATLTQSAVRGGFTRLAILPATQPVVDNAALLRQLRAEFAAACPALAVSFWGALTLSLAGKQLTDLGDLKAAAAAGFTDARALPSHILYPALDYAQALGKPVGVSLCRSPHPIRDGAMALRLGLPSAPHTDETGPLAALIEQVKIAPTPVHVMRLSTARGVALVARAKADGLPVSASTTWIHLLQDTTHLTAYDPNLRVHPPLGNPDDREALIDGVVDGTIDAIAIDHCPHPYEEKTVAFAESPPGVTGLQVALPLLWSHLVETNRVSALALWRALSAHPAHCLQQSPPQIALGQVAELTLFDPADSWDATPEAIASLSRNFPWLNKTIAGRVVGLWTPTMPPKLSAKQ